MDKEELMSDLVFDRLVDCDPGLAWELCRKDVGRQLLGYTPLTIPFIDDADSFIPFGVFAEENGRTKSSDKKLPSPGGGPVYRVIGSMETLSDPEVDVTPFQQRPELVETQEFDSKYVYQCTKVRHGLKKSISVKVSDTKCYDVSMTGEVGKLALNKNIPQLKNVKTIYIIFEVYYAMAFKISVTFGEQLSKYNYMDTRNSKFILDRPMPIGFSAQKFPLRSNGLIGPQEETYINEIRNAQWKRSSLRKSFGDIRSASKAARNKSPLRSHTLPPFPTK